MATQVISYLYNAPYHPLLGGQVAPNKLNTHRHPILTALSRSLRLASFSIYADGRSDTVPSPHCCLRGNTALTPSFCLCDVHTNGEAEAKQDRTKLLIERSFWFTQVQFKEFYLQRKAWCWFDISADEETAEVKCFCQFSVEKLTLVWWDCVCVWWKKSTSPSHLCPRTALPHHLASHLPLTPMTFSLSNFTFSFSYSLPYVIGGLFL